MCFHLQNGAVEGIEAPILPLRYSFYIKDHINELRI